MYLVITRSYPPEIGGMQNLMWGLTNSLSKYFMIKVYADEHHKSEDYDKKVSFSIERVGGIKLLRKYRKAQLINEYIKETKVNGVFNKDPEIHKDAKHYKQISYSEILSKNLRIMDMTAITLCKENNLPIRVFDVNSKGNLNSILNGKDIGTFIS